MFLAVLPKEIEREGGQNEYGRHGADRTERVRIAFCRQNFRNEHNEEEGKEKGVNFQSRIADFSGEADREEMEKAANRVNDSKKKGHAGERIQNGIRRKILAPVLITPKIIFPQSQR